MTGLHSLMWPLFYIMPDPLFKCTCPILNLNLTLQVLSVCWRGSTKLDLFSFSCVTNLFEVQKCQHHNRRYKSRSQNVVTWGFYRTKLLVHQADFVILYYITRLIQPHPVPPSSKKTGGKKQKDSSLQDCRRTYSDLQQQSWLTKLQLVCPDYYQLQGLLVGWQKLQLVGSIICSNQSGL